MRCLLLEVMVKWVLRSYVQKLALRSGAGLTDLSYSEMRIRDHANRRS